MNRQAQGIMLLLLGGAVVKATVFSDIYLRYVKESLRPFLIAAAVMLVIAGLMAIVNDLRAPSAEDEHHGHDHGDKPHHEPRVGWMLIAPALGLLLVAPPALGAFAAGQSGSAVLQESDLYPPLPEGDPARISVLDYATRAVFDKGKSMKDRKVLVSGFLSDGPTGGQVLTRMMLSCCAADARPIKVGLSGDAPGGLPNDQWVEVTGVYTTRTVEDPVNGVAIPFIEVIEWKQIEPPRNQYE